MAGADHNIHRLRKKPPDRKSRWESNSPAPKNPKKAQFNTSDSKSANNPNIKSIKPANSNVNKKPTPLPSQSRTGPSPSNRQHPSSTHRQPYPFLYPDPSRSGSPHQPTYGFHMLLRRSILLADGTVRSYFTLPPDYEEFAARPPLLFDGPGEYRGGRMSPEESQDYWKSLGLDNMDGGRVGEEGMKRKFRDAERDRVANDGEYLRQRQKLRQYG